MPQGLSPAEVRHEIAEHKKSGMESSVTLAKASAIRKTGGRAPSEVWCVPTGAGLKACEDRQTRPAPRKGP
jgi:hypothetical protein